MAQGFHDGRVVTRAKVWVSDSARIGSSYGPGKGGQATENLTLTFCNGNDKDSENARFWDASPTTQPWKLTIANRAAQGLLEVGKEYYVDFVEALPDEPAE